MIRPLKLAPALFTVLAVTMLARPARAAITLYDKDAWTLSIGGRSAGLLQLRRWRRRGDGGQSDGQADRRAAVRRAPDGDGKFVTSRMRGGWGGCMFGLNVTNQITAAAEGHGAFVVLVHRRGGPDEGAPQRQWQPGRPPGLREAGGTLRWGAGGAQPGAALACGAAAGLGHHRRRVRRRQPVQHHRSRPHLRAGRLRRAAALVQRRHRVQHARAARLPAVGGRLQSGAHRGDGLARAMAARRCRASRPRPCSTSR